MRFSGCIKLIQIYIPGQHTRREASRSGAVRFTSDCDHGYSIVSRELGLHRVGVNLSFLSPENGRYEQKEPRWHSVPFSLPHREARWSGTRGYGPVTTHLPRHNGAAYALRPACRSALCIVRPDFTRIPRRATRDPRISSKRVHSCICAIRRNRGKARLVETVAELSGVSTNVRIVEG